MRFSLSPRAHATSCLCVRVCLKNEGGGQGGGIKGEGLHCVIQAKFQSGDAGSRWAEQPRKSQLCVSGQMGSESLAAGDVTSSIPATAERAFKIRVPGVSVK